MSERTEHRARTASLAGGILLAALGILFLLNNVHPFLHAARVWPLFLLVPVIPMAIRLMEQGRREAGLVVPITILTFYCGHFLWLTHSHWHKAGITWPNFLLGPGLGFLFLYFIERRGPLLAPAFILIGLAAAFYGGIYDTSLPLGGFLVLAGVIVVLGSRRK